MNKPTKQSALRREILFSAAVTLIYSLPFILRLNNWGIHDWELFTAMGEIPRILIFKFGQFPYWNPYLGGGNILFHHPEVGVLSPLYLLTLAFGAVVGLKLQAIVCYFLGFWGTIRLARQLGITEISAYLVSIIYFGSSYFALHFAEGHIPFTQFCFLPWIGYFWLKSHNAKKFIAYGGITLALMLLGNGAAAPFLLTATFLGFVALLYAISDRHIVPLINFFAIALLGVMLASVKFIPMLAYLMQNPWGGEPYDVVPLRALLDVFFSVNQSLNAHADLNLSGGWHEYGAYLSPLTVILALVAVFRNSPRKWIWIISAVFFLVLGLGGFSDWAPWKLLSELPGYSSSRAPGRMFQFVILAVAILAAFGLDHLRDSIAKISKPPRAAPLAPMLTFFVIATFNVIIAYGSLTQSFSRQSEPVQWNDSFEQRIGDPLYVYKSSMQNTGTILAPWLSAYKEGRGLVTADGTVMREYVQSGKLTIQSAQYRGNTINYTVDVTSPGRLVFGMGFDPGWSVTSPEQIEVTSEQDLLAVNLPPGKTEITLSYRTPYFFTGLIVSLLGLFATAYVLRRM